MTSACSFFAEPEKVNDSSRCRTTPLRTPASVLPTAYTPFSFEWASAYRALYALTPAHSIAFSLPNLWAWRDWIGLEARFAHGLAWLRCTSFGGYHLAPVGPWNAIDWKPLQAELQSMQKIVQVPEPLALLWKEQLTCPLEITENRNSWEYLYTADDLAKLAGKRYHMQRNHVNAYAREHGEPDLRPLCESDVPAMLAVTERWHEHHAVTETTKAEIDSLHRICASWEQFDLVSEGLFLDDTLVAFAVGYDLDDTTLAVLYEKADSTLRGAFPIMASSFARLAVERGKERVNRAEDMGEEGMRKSKMLYRPVDFERMCIVTL